MTKYTRRQYNTEIAANDAALTAVDAQLDSYATRSEAGADVNSMADAWNAAWDVRYALEQERLSIERRRLMRNWTWQDHSFAELVSANLD
jgi:hypothetical protein